MAKHQEQTNDRLQRLSETSRGYETHVMYFCVIGPKRLRELDNLCTKFESYKSRDGVD